MPMLHRQLSRITEFHHLSASELKALSRRVHVVCVPAGRKLVRDKCNLEAYCYLLRGKLQTQDPVKVLRARNAGVLRHFYPGCRTAQAISSVHVLRIDAQQYDFLAAAPSNSPNSYTQSEDEWLQYFLNSHMMRHVSTDMLKKMVASFTVQRFGRGQRVLHCGAKGDECFVIQAGHAVVHRAGRTLAYLGPGDLFGEDALVLGLQRNADVTALEEMRVQTIHRKVFRQLLVEHLVEEVSEVADAGVVLDLNTHVGLQRQHFIANLRQQAANWSVHHRYYIAGGQPPERALCVLILIQLGMRAYALAA